MTIQNRVIAFGLAGALAIGVSADASAGPMPLNPGVKNAPVGQVTDVRWRGRGGGWGAGPALGIGAGLAAGALIGSAVAARPYGGYYYDEPGYAYAEPYAVVPAPTYYGSYGYRNWGYGPCFTDEGYGRRTSCDSSR